MPKNGDTYLVEEILSRIENRVVISGSVFRPGQYELESGLTLRGLIKKADGIQEDAFLDRGYINRLNADKTPNLITFNLAKIIAGTESDIILQREDIITINSIFDLKDEYKITVQGEVRKSGVFQYSDNMNITTLIQMAGGFKEGATPDRIEISRRVKDSDPTSTSAKTAELYNINIDPNLKIETEKFLLKPFDLITVRNSEKYQVQKQVSIEGEVVNPGLYTIAKKDERISDLISRSGGLTPTAFIEGVSLIRPINTNEIESQKLQNMQRLQGNIENVISSRSDMVGIELEKVLATPGSKYDLILQEGDVLKVPKQLQTVRITGEVLRPSSIVYTEGDGFKKYINGSGGFTEKAFKRYAYITYANGSTQAVRKFLFFNNYPRVRPGSEIFVTQKPPREKLNAQAWIGIGTGLASLAAIILTLLR